VRQSKKKNRRLLHGLVWLVASSTIARIPSTIFSNTTQYNTTQHNTTHLYVPSSILCGRGKVVVLSGTTVGSPLSLGKRDHREEENGQQRRGGKLHRGGLCRCRKKWWAVSKTIKTDATASVVFFSCLGGNFNSLLFLLPFVVVFVSKPNRTNRIE
jgi:hypothetical protein